MLLLNVYPMSIVVILPFAVDEKNISRFIVSKVIKLFHHQHQQSLVGGPKAEVTDNILQDDLFVVAFRGCEYGLSPL